MSFPNELITIRGETTNLRHTLSNIYTVVAYLYAKIHQNWPSFARGEGLPPKPNSKLKSKHFQFRKNRIDHPIIPRQFQLM